MMFNRMDGKNQDGPYPPHKDANNIFCNCGSAHAKDNLALLKIGDL